MIENQDQGLNMNPDRNSDNITKSTTDSASRTHSTPNPPIDPATHRSQTRRRDTRCHDDETGLDQGNETTGSTDQPPTHNTTKEGTGICLRSSRTWHFTSNTDSDHLLTSHESSAITGTQLNRFVMFMTSGSLLITSLQHTQRDTLSRSPSSQRASWTRGVTSWCTWSCRCHANSYATDTMQARPTTCTRSRSRCASSATTTRVENTTPSTAPFEARERTGYTPVIKVII